MYDSELPPVGYWLKSSTLRFVALVVANVAGFAGTTSPWLGVASADAEADLDIRQRVKWYW